MFYNLGAHIEFSVILLEHAAFNCLKLFLLHTRTRVKKYTKKLDFSYTIFAR